MTLPALPTTTYGVLLKGESSSYALGIWQALTWEQLCVIISDVTGYNVAFLKRDLPNRFNKLGYAQISPASGHEGSVPGFLIRSSDGRVPARM